MMQLDATRIEKSDVLIVIALVALGVVASTGVTGAVVIALFLLATLLCSISPTAGLTAVMVALPWTSHPVPVTGHVSFGYLEVALVAAGMGVAVHAGLGVVRRRTLEPLRDLVSPAWLVVVCGALVLAGVLSLFTVVDPERLDNSLRTFRRVIVEPTFVVFLVRWARRNGTLALPVFALLGTAAATTLLGIWGIIQGRGVGTDGLVRAKWPYSHPNAMALALGREAIFGVALALALPRSRVRTAVWVAMAIAFVGILTTFSRGSMLGLVVGSLAIGYTLRRPGIIKVAVSAALAVSIGFAALASERLFDMGGESDQSSRWLIWRSSFTMIADHPWSGIGLDQFLGQYGRRYISVAGWPERYSSHPHNLLLDTWLSLGVIGLLVGLAMFITAVWWGNALRNDESPPPLGVAAIALLAYGIAHGMVDNSFFLADLAVLTWFAFALLSPDRRKAIGE